MSAAFTIALSASGAEFAWTVHANPQPALTAFVNSKASDPLFETHRSEDQVFVGDRPGTLITLRHIERRCAHMGGHSRTAFRV
jgi:hypothetical protein